MPTPMADSRPFVTGASGFVGRAVMARLGGNAFALPMGGEDWQERLRAARLDGATVYHLAARVHGPGEVESLFERDNVAKTIELARAAATARARRFVFLSSIKVNGEETGGSAFRPHDPPAPQDAYARSKWKAEQALADISREHGLPIVIVRSPLVIGPRAPGNLRALLRVADTPWPLPFAALENRRTFVGVEDLARLLEACGTSPDSVGRTFLAGDPRPMSTARLVALMRGALKRPARLFDIPAARLEALAAFAGQSERMRRLTRSLEVDVTDTMRRLSWEPVIALETAIDQMAEAYRAEQGAAR